MTDHDTLCPVLDFGADEVIGLKPLCLLVFGCILVSGWFCLFLGTCGVCAFVFKGLTGVTDRVGVAVCLFLFHDIIISA